jgi:hypothetical protein
MRAEGCIRCFAVREILFSLTVHVVNIGSGRDPTISRESFDDDELRPVRVDSYPYGFASRIADARNMASVYVVKGLFPFMETRNTDRALDQGVRWRVVTYEREVRAQTSIRVMGLSPYNRIA